jgi:hypothetical protein
MQMLPKINRVRQFAALNRSQKLIFVEAWFLLGWMRVATLTISFKRLTASLQHHKETVHPVSLASEQLNQAAWVGGLVASAAKYTPWQSPCLTQVLAVQRLLARRGIPGQFYLGVRKRAGKEMGCEALQAHAWLQCGDLIVSGGAGHEEFTVVSTFSWGRS